MKNATAEPTRHLSSVDLAGKFLVAMPGLQDTRFETAVIYIIEDGEDGTMGVVVNKPFLSIAFQDLIKQLDLPEDQKIRPFGLHNGGPVDSGRGLILHTQDYMVEATQTLADGLAVTGTQDVLKAMSLGEGPKRAFFALGYTGWDKGQLEDELKQNLWLITKSDPQILFDTALEMRWHTVLANNGINPGQLSVLSGVA